MCLHWHIVIDLHTYVCMRLHILYVHICTYACIHVCTYVCTVCTYVCALKCVHVCYLRTYVCVCVCGVLATGGKKRGFAFVQFTNVFSAGQAMEALNSSEIKGTPLLRTVAIARSNLSHSCTWKPPSQCSDGHVWGHPWSCALQCASQFFLTLGCSVAYLVCFIWHTHA